MSEHSKEPWCSIENSDYAELLDADNRWIAHTHQRLGGPIAIFHHANAERIVQCVNACAGIADPAAALAAAREALELAQNEAAQADCCCGARRAVDGGLLDLELLCRACRVYRTTKQALRLLTAEKPAP